MSDPVLVDWDYILLAGVKSPGLCDVKGAGRPLKWDVVEGYMMDGAALKYGGRGLASFSVTFRFYTNEELEEWRAFARRFTAMKVTREQGKALGSSLALDIMHPVLADLDITSVVLEDVGALEQTMDSGEWSATMKFKEYRPLKATGGVVKGSENAEPPDPYDDKINGLRTVYQGLANG